MSTSLIEERHRRARVGSKFLLQFRRRDVWRGCCRASLQPSRFINECN
jgi:hypothetical protein